MSLDLVRVKEEREGVIGVSEAAVTGDLYDGHEVKEELVLGPEVFQPPDISFVLRNPFKENGKPIQGEAQRASASENSHHRRDGTVGDTALHAEPKVKQELLCPLRGPPMVHIPSPSVFGDLYPEISYVKNESATEPEGTSETLLQEKYRARYDIKQCSVPLIRIDELSRKTSQDGVNNNRCSTDKITTRKPKKFYCDYCSKGFSMKQSLQTHVRIHTGEKPYSCKICKKTFSDLSILIRHRRIHTGEKPHVCDVCQKQFSEKYLLRYHKRIHTGDTPYVCKYCSKTYNHISNLNRHLRTHEKPFICEICNSNFSLQSRLDKHLLSHLKEKPFACDLCDKCFSIKGHLNRHLKIHLDVKDYCCKVCKAKFSQRASLRRHVDRNVCVKP